MASDSIEERLSRLLWAGVIAAVALCLVGMALYVLEPPGSAAYSAGGSAVITGVAILLLTPAARVAMLFFHYVRIRDYDFVLITIFVMAMMILGYLAGVK